MSRIAYPSDVTDEEWSFALAYLELMTLDAPQRHHDLREVFNALRWIVRTGAQWQYLPHEFPVWTAVYQQSRRWIAAGVFGAMMHDLRVILRLAAGRSEQPTAAILDSRTRQSTPPSGARAAYDGAKRKRGTKIHIAVDTLGHLLALHVTAGNKQDREQVGPLLSAVQEVTENCVETAFADQGYTGEGPTAAAAARGVELVVIKLPEARKGFVLLPRRWVVEIVFPQMAKTDRLALGCGR